MTQPPYPPQPPYQQQPPHPPRPGADYPYDAARYATTTVYVSGQVRGLSTSTHVVHGILTVCTGGLWALVWLAHWLSRRR